MLGFSLLLYAGLPCAQEPPPPSTADVFQQAKDFKKSDLYKQQFAPGGPNDPKTAVEQAMKVVRQKQNSAIEAPAATSGVDIKAILDRAGTSGRSVGDMKGVARDRLVVFVSFSMPDKALLQMLLATNRAGGTVAFRGFKNDNLDDTKVALEGFVRAGARNITISPSDFKRYGVHVVPAVALARDEVPEGMCAGSTCDTSQYVLVTGDVSLDYSLEYIAKQSVEFAPLADRYLAKLRSQR